MTIRRKQMKSRVFRSRGAGILASVWFIGAFASSLLVSPVVCAQERAIEGQPIAAISIVDSSGKPVSQENLSMPLAVGQPFDYSNERDAIRVLYRTGDFADIQVHADSSPAVHSNSQFL
jgi:outer membrane protein assembly factor BamA